MTRQELIRMAREAGLMSVRMSKALEEIRFSQLDHFATLAAERDTVLLRQALEALEVASNCLDGYYIPRGKTNIPEAEAAITALRERLGEKV
jgi:hypothetical protein